MSSPPRTQAELQAAIAALQAAKEAPAASPAPTLAASIADPVEGAPAPAVAPPAPRVYPDNFPACLDFVFGFDGLQNDRAPTEHFDTAYGVTQYTWGDAIVMKLVPNKPVTQATKEECELVLRVMFYAAIGCDKMPPGCDLMVFNHGMACGTGTAAMLVQRVVGATVDGRIGPHTLAAVQAFGDKAFIDAMCARDEAYYAGLANAPTYLRGWDRREEAAKALAYKMAGVV